MALRARTAMSSEAPRRIDGLDWAVRSIYEFGGAPSD